MMWRLNNPETKKEHICRERKKKEVVWECDEAFDRALNKKLLSVKLSCDHQKLHHSLLPPFMFCVYYDPKQCDNNLIFSLIRYLLK